ncbi:uncharacterized protein LOC135219584 isoform X3 [Macrobrachium nipponense]
MGDPVQAIINNEEWRKEKLDFICSVVSNVDQESLLTELGYCETDEDAEGLMQSLILLQDKELPPHNDITSQQRMNGHVPLNDIIVRLPEECEEESIIVPSEEQFRDDHDNEEEAEGSDSDDSCYFTPDIFNSSQTEQPEAEELAEVVNNVELGNNESDGSEFAAEMAQAIAESAEMTGAVAQVEAERTERENRIMHQAAILSDLFSNADPDFLQERIDKCMKLEGDEEAFHLLYEECLDIKNYPTMKDYIKRRKRTSVTENDISQDIVIIDDTKALAENLTVECGICLEENILGIDTNTCSALKNEHTYCNHCIKRYVEAQIGQGLTVFKCMEGYCDAEFSLRMLQKLIEPPVFDKLWERRQQEEIAAAGVENLESCPFCNYMVSMPNQEDKIFQCWNPDCMIDSCRICKEPSHIPFRCDEIEKKGQRNARTYLENEMAEAMIRECPRCKKRFIIEAGCNRMTCPCGAIMCYVCKQLIDTTNGDGYSHFERGPVPSEKCPLYSNAAALHEEEVRDAAERAKQGLDPQVSLLHDPTANL